MTDLRQIKIDPLSIRSLHIELLALGRSIGVATGIICKSNERNWLVTNWHVLSGRSPQTGQPQHPKGAIPDQVRIAHHSTKLGTWKLIDETLLDSSQEPLWIEHPNGNEVDVAALPLTHLDKEILLYDFDLSLADTDLVPQVAMPVSIIGFPLGFSSAGAFPIWKTGHIASDPELDYQGIPAFLIDATTRLGMSGSPVVVRLFGGYATRSGTLVMASGSQRTRFLGLYSGRIHQDSEIGLVWRPRLISELISQ